MMQEPQNAEFTITPFYIDQFGYWRSQRYSNNTLYGIDQAQYHTEKGTFPYSFSMIDYWFPVIHGQYGEDGQLQQILQRTEIPYIGSDAKTSYLCYDKISGREKAKKLGIHQPQYLFFSYPNDESDSVIRKSILQNIGLPCFIKPSETGSSIGISRISNENMIIPAIKAACIYDKKIIVEKAVEDCVEYELAFIGNKRRKFSRPGTMEYQDEFYTTQAKYRMETTKLIAVTDIDQQLKNQLYDMATRLIEQFEVKDLGRIDFLYDKKNNRLYWNEINTIPGFTQKSMFPFLWKEEGMNFIDLLTHIIKDPYH